MHSFQPVPVMKATAEYWSTKFVYNESEARGQAQESAPESVTLAR